MADAVPPADELPKHCYMVISVAGSPPETVIFELDTATCPRTSHNFASLCASPGKAARPSRNNVTMPRAVPTYRNTEFHRVKPGFIVQGGDYDNFDGTGGRSIYSTSTFEDESFANNHHTEGILSMANRGKATNGSQFFITLGNAASHLDGKHVAFGRVVHGMDLVRLMASVETDEKDRPISMQRIVVVDCGIGKGNVNSKEGDRKSEGKNTKKEKRGMKHNERGRSNPSSSDSSSSGSTSSYHRHRSSKKHKKRKRERSSSRSRDRGHYSSDERHRSSHKKRKSSKKKHRHRERDYDRKRRRRSRSR